MVNYRKIILIVVPYLYDGGAERVASLWANYLSEQSNYDVHLLTYFKLEKEYWLSDKVTRHSFFEKESDYKLHKYLRLYLDSKRIRKYVKTINPDFVVPFSHITCICTSIACKNKKTIVVHTIRNNPWLEPNKGWVRFLRDRYIKKDKNLIAQNEEQLEYFKDYSVNKYVVSNPINDKLISISKTQYGNVNRFVAVGRLASQKNYFVMIDSIKKVIDSGLKCRLDIYGEGPLKDQLNEYINQNGLSNVVSLKGNTKEIFETIKEYDAFLMTSDFEGFPNSLLEAMAIGLPVISTDCKTGPKDLIENGVTGLLAKTNDSDDIANKIAIYINNPILAKEYAIKGREIVLNKYSKTNIINQLSLVFK